MIERTSFRPCQFAPWLVAALFACATLNSAAADDTRPFAKWFKYSADIESTWDVIGNSAQPMNVVIRQKEPTGPEKRILVLYPRASSAYDTAITEMLRLFSAKEINARFAVTNFEMDDGRAKSAVQDAENNKFDLIFAMGSESAAWLYTHYRGGLLPVVTVCSKDPVLLGQMKDYESGSGTNIAFTSLNVPVEVQMAYVRELRPDLKNIAILVDKKNISSMQTQAEPIAAYAKKKGIQIIWGTVQNPDKARDELTKIIPDAVHTMRQTDPELNNSLFWVTGSTAVFREIITINKFSDRVPVVSVVPEIVTPGADTAVLAIGVSFESNARLAAIYGAQILNGSKPGNLKVGLVSPPDVAISFMKARAIGLRIPFNFFEIASFVYDYKGEAVRTANKDSEHSQ